MILYTDENAVIDGGLTPFRNLPMCQNKEIIKPELEPGLYGDIGDSAELCYANHVHPFDGACFKDAEYESFIKVRAEAELWIEQKTSESIFIKILDSGFLQIMSDVITVLLLDQVVFSAVFANILIMILNAASGLGIKEIDVDGVATNIDKVVDKIREKYQ